MDLDQETEIPQAEGAPQQNAYPPAVSNIAQEINNHTPVWRVILLFLIFQPIALFIIFKEKYYHSWIAFLLWLHAILLLIVYIIMKISVLPQLESLYKNLNLTGSFPIINLLLIVFIIFMLAQIIFGIFVFYKNRLIGYLSKGLLAATLVFFIIDLFISPAFIIIGLLNPLYNLISSVEKQTTIEAFQLSPTPTPDPTTNWKTYANKKYGYSIKHPTTWIAVENESNSINIVGMGKGSEHGFTSGGQNILLEVAPYNLEPKEYIKVNLSPSSNPIKMGGININGNNGEKWSFNNNNEDDNYAIFFVINNKLYVILKTLSNKSLYKDYDLEIENVISTFKFLE